MLLFRSVNEEVNKMIPNLALTWNDSVSREFCNRYHDNVNKITDKLIKKIEDYIEFASSARTALADYTEALAVASLTAAAGLSTGAAVIGNNVTLPSERSENSFTLPDGNVVKFETIDLKPEQEIFLNKVKMKVVPIDNGCGPKEGVLERVAASIGAGVDAARNSDNPILFGMGSAVVPSFFGVAAVSVAGRILNPKEYDRLQTKACGQHDICYFVSKDQAVCDRNFGYNGGGVMSKATRIFGAGAHKAANEEGELYIERIRQLAEKYGKVIKLPTGYTLEAVK